MRIITRTKHHFLYETHISEMTRPRFEFESELCGVTVEKVHSERERERDCSSLALVIRSYSEQLQVS